MKPGADLTGDLRLYRRLLGYAWPYRWMFVIAVMGMLLSAVTASWFSSLMKPLVDEGFVQRYGESMRQLPLLIILAFLARAVTSFVGEFTITWIGRKVTSDLRNASFNHLLRLPCGYFDVQGTGAIVPKLIFNIEQISAATTTALIVIVGDGLTAVALFTYLFWLNWKLTLLVLVVAPITMLLVRAMSRGFRRKSHQIQDSMREIARVANQASAGHRVIKIFGAAAEELRAFMAVNERNRRQVMRKTTLSAGGMGFVQWIASFGLALMIYVALNHMQISAGEFVAYVVALTIVTGPLRRLSRVTETLQTGLAAASTTFALLDEPAEQDDGVKTLDRARGRVEYRNVSYRYATASSEALRDVSFMIEPGQTVALVGASGSGKTTLASLLPRFYRVTSGEIRIDGINLNDFTLANLRSHIALVGQETLLFDDTIANNITYGASDSVDRERLVQAARAAHVLEFAERLSQGLDTRVGEKGALFSGGQRQRVAIARALYKNAPILVLDEATSALDSESERLVQDAMRRLLANRTTLVIAHRLSTVEHADRIVVLSRAEIIESGTHRELLARGSAYAALYRAQFANAE